jgi:hypothetical protein
MNLHHHQYKNRIPPSVANVLADRKNKDTNINCEKVLVDTLVSIRALIFRYHASTMSHDMSSVMGHVFQRAEEANEDDLSILISRLKSLQGPSNLHKITAYTQLTRQLVNDLEAAIFDENKNNVDLLQHEKMLMQQESLKIHNLLGRDLASKEQEVNKLTNLNQELELKVKALTRSNDSLKNELEQTLRDQANTHQLAVELRYLFIPNYYNKLRIIKSINLLF